MCLARRVGASHVIIVEATVEGICLRQEGSVASRVNGRVILFLTRWAAMSLVVDDVRMVCWTLSGWTWKSLTIPGRYSQEEGHLPETPLMVNPGWTVVPLTTTPLRGAAKERGTFKRRMRQNSFMVALELSQNHAEKVDSSCVYTSRLKNCMLATSGSTSHECINWPNLWRKVGQL